MKYQLVQSTEAGLVSSFFPQEGVIAAMSIRGFEVSGRSKVGGVLRKELQGQPEFRGVAGPMWGGTDDETGEPIVRYEDWKSYDILST